MATFIPCPGVAEFVLNMVLAGQQVKNIIHVKNSADWTSASLLAEAQAIQSAWATYILPYLSNELNFVGVTGKDLTTSMGVTADSATVPGTNGARPGEASPGNVALAIAEKTGLAGRSARGRLFLAGIRDQDIVLGNLVAGFAAGLLPAFNNFQIAIEAGGLLWGVLSKFSGYTQTPPKYKKVPTPRAEGIFNHVVSILIDSVVDSQRRRLPGRGI